MELQDAEEGVNGGHWKVDEELDILSLHIVVDFDLEQVEWVGNE